MYFHAQIVPFVVFVGLVGLAIAILHLGLPGAFLLDDSSSIRPAQIDQFTLPNLVNTVFSNGSGPLGRPVSILSFALNDYVSGYMPAPYKYVNIMLHALCAVLLFWLLGHILSVVNERKSLPISPWLASAVISGFWSLHPLHVSTTLYAVQRMTQLSTLFVLAALITYVIARRQPTLRNPVPVLLLAVVFPLFAILGIFSKEDAVLIPVFVLVLEFSIFRCQTTKTSDRPVLLSIIWLYGLVPIVLGGLYFLTHMTPLLEGYNYREFTLTERVASQSVIIWDYVRMIALPRLADMTLYHDSEPIRSFHQALPWAGLLGLIIAVLIAWRMRGRFPILAFGILFFLSAHLLESTVMPLELMFEHRNYLASAGILTIIVVEGARLLSITSFERHGIALLLVPLLVLSISLTTVRASTWSSHGRLVLTAAAEHPESVRAQTEVANFWLRHGQIQKARTILRDALARSEAKSVGILLHLLSTYCFDSQMPVSTIEQVRTKMADRGLDAYATQGLYVLLERDRANQCPAMPAETLAELMIHATTSDRTRPGYRYGLHRMAGIAAARANKWDTAIDQFNKAEPLAQYAPPALQPDATLKLSRAYLMTGQIDPARHAVDRLISMNKSPLVNLDEEIRARKNWLNKLSEFTALEEVPHDGSLQVDLPAPATAR